MKGCSFLREHRVSRTNEERFGGTKTTDYAGLGMRPNETRLPARKPGRSWEQSNSSPG